MTWRDDLLPGSIGGIRFDYDQVSYTTGRDTAVHEFHGDRQAWVEDNGRATRRWKVDVWIAGSDYHLTRGLLEELFETPGPYTFVDPLRGDFEVRLGQPVTFSERREEGGLVRIGQLDLVEAGEPFPLIFSGSAKLASLSFDAATALANGTAFSIGGAIDKVLASITAGIFAASSAVNSVNSKVAAKLGAANLIAAQISELERSINTLRNTPTALMSSLSNIALQVTSLIGSFRPEADSVEVVEPVFPLVEIASEAVADLVGFLTEPDATSWVPPESQQSQIDASAHQAISINMQASGVIGGADLAGKIPFDSAAQAGQYLDQLIAGFDQVMAEPSLDPSTYQAMAALRAATINELQDRQAELPDIVAVTPPTVMPALVLAWELYSDPERADDIVRRNRIRHPGFVPARALEVLADA